MTDIATLGLEVRSDGVVVASNRLKQLTADGATAESATNKLSSSFRGFERYVSAAQAALAAFGLASFAKSAIDAALQMERLSKMMTAASGNTSVSGREMEYVKGVVNRLGLDLATTTESYAKFVAAIRGTTLEGERGRRVFESVSSATNALGMRADETAGVFKALEQMMSKGKVQAEELRGQLGERLPGAFRLAADAMGMTTAELDKNLAAGKVLAEDLLPKLATQLDKTFGTGVMTAQNQINLMNNAMLESKATIGSALMPVFTDLMTSVLTPLAKLIGDIVRGLQSMAAAAALVWNQFSGGMRDLFSGRLFTREGYKQSMDDALENEKIYKEQMEKIWGGAKGSDYSAAEKLRQAMNKPSKPLDDDKSARRAQELAERQARYNKAVLDAEAALREQYNRNRKTSDEAELRDRLSRLQYEKEMGLKTLQEYLDEKHNILKAAAQRELIEAKALAHQKYLDYSKVSKDAGADRLLQAKAEEAWQRSVEKSIQAQAKLNQLTTAKPLDDARINLQTTKDQLFAEQQLLSIRGAEYNSMLKQIELNSLNRQTLDQITQSILKEVDAIRLKNFAIQQEYALKAQQINNQYEIGAIKNNTMGMFQQQPDQYKSLDLEYTRESALVIARQQELEKLGELNEQQIEEHQHLTSKLTAIDAQYAANKKRLDRENWEKGAASIANSLETVGNLLMKGNKDQFEAGKDMALASASISMTLGAIQAYTSMTSIPYIGPALGAIAAAAVIASGTARIAQIESMKYEAREFGGPVNAGQTYIVGEKRPELFTPSVSGHITPYVPTGGGTTVSTTQVFQISTGVPETVRAEIARIAPTLMQMSVGAVRSAMRDGQFAGA